MARLIFRPSPGATGSKVRIDTASGSNTPANITPIDRGQAIPGAILQAGHVTGNVPAFYGPDGVTTLYEKQLDYAGNVTGTIATLTGAVLETPGLVPGGGTTVPLQGLSIGKGAVNVPLGLMTHAAFDAVSNGSTDLKISNVAFHALSDPAASVVLPIFTNQGVSTAGGAVDLNAPNVIYVSCAVVTSDGTVVDFKFNGQHTGTVQVDGSPLIPDAPIAFGAQVSANDKYGNPIARTGVILRVTVSCDPPRTDTVTNTSGNSVINDSAITAADQGRKVASGGGVPAGAYVGAVTPGVSFVLSSTPYPISTPLVTTSAVTSVTLQSFIPFNLGYFASTDASSATGAADATLPGASAPSGGAYSYRYGPAALLGRSKLRVPTVYIASDSIPDGYSEDFHSGYFGFVQRACLALGYNMVKVSRGGETAASFAAPSSRRMRSWLMDGCTHAMVGFGTNDGVNSAGQATLILGRLTTIGNDLVRAGIKPYVLTVPPRTSSTDTWATTGNQTPISLVSPLATINQTIRGGLTPYLGYADMEGACSSAQDSGLWAAGATGDGVHPSDALMRGAIYNAVLTLMSTWSV
jgi:hypothetical protein